jgi:Dual specificity phosphatase, catalytic domain.
MSATQLIGGIYISDITFVEEGDTSMFDSVIGVCQDDRSDNVSCSYDHFNMSDGPVENEENGGHNPGEFGYDIFSDAVDRAIARRVLLDTILIHCHAGRSRSAAVAITTMAVMNGMTWEEALEYAKEQRECIDISPELVELGKEYVSRVE